MQPVRNEEWDNDNVWCAREFIPIRNQRRLFHVSVQDGRVFALRADSLGLAFRGDGAVVIQLCSVRNNEQCRFTGIDIRRHFASARQQQLGHDAVIADRFTIFPDLSITTRRNRPF